MNQADFAPPRMQLRLLVTVALGLAAIASAQTQGSDLMGGGPKCLTSSETMSMKTGACGTFKVALTGMCAQSKEQLDNMVKLAAGMMQALGTSEELLSEADCKLTGQAAALQYCEAVSADVGDGKTKLKAKAGLDYCKDFTCSLLGMGSKIPQECMTDAHCPKGEEIKMCCSLAVSMVKKFCEVTDDQIKTLSLTKMASNELFDCSNDATKCFSAGFRHTASVIFALAMGWLAVLISSESSNN